MVKKLKIYWGFGRENSPPYQIHIKLFKKYLRNRKVALSIGKANVTGYCINLKTVKEINIDVLKKAIQYGLENSNEKY